MNEIEYHLGELKIACTPGDSRRVMPVLPDTFRSILDLGCGIGQTLISCQLNPGTFACGVDIDAESLAYGKQLTPSIHFVRASGERLPFGDRAFETVVSRISLPYLHIPNALQEIARILTPGGHIWFTLHSFRTVWEDALGAIRSWSPKNVAYAIYVLINGVCLHLAGRQFRYPLNRNKCESFQAVEGMTKAMRKAGFEHVRIECDHSWSSRRSRGAGRQRLQLLSPLQRMLRSVGPPPKKAQHIISLATRNRRPPSGCAGIARTHTAR